MDVVLVGLPGSGKTAVGRRLARRHDAEFVDVDQQIEALAGRSVAEIFAADGEPAFRALERAAVAGLGPPDRRPGLTRVIATGGGAPVDPRNRWLLYRGRVTAWLDGPPEAMAQRLRRSPTIRPLVAGRDPLGTVRALALARARFYAPAGRVNALMPVQRVVEVIEQRLAAGPAAGAAMLRADTAIGRIEIGDGNAPGSVADALATLGARRTIVVSEPKAWSVAGAALTAALAGRADEPLLVEHLVLPRGEDAKRLAVVERAARQLAAMGAERGDPLVAVGGGALGDAAGLLAAIYLRGVPLVHVPTTLVAQVDSSIGGKTAVDLPEGKNLVGAFHQPVAVAVDVGHLRTLPGRHLRAALGEAVKMAALGNERLVQLLEEEGPAIAAADAGPFERGSVAELVERCAWAKVEVVLADEREQGERISLNLGHSLAHAIEAAAEYRGILHGEAVAYGLRAACRIGTDLGVTPPDRATRIEDLLDRLELGRATLALAPAAVLAHLATDKKRRAGRLRWVLPTETGWTVRSDVPDDLVERVATGVLAGDGRLVEGRP
ncbi:MAG: bifunctional shikimate kinase/3-dehydroquinate synthase [Chloroflexi bacterium]|jgi:shikimate kinase/3-dehydroquinate synthase|nr:bifunctional shikimate kinase/3-dehydroquinate synthase [Chloroflexota bacterium]